MKTIFKKLALSLAIIGLSAYQAEATIAFNFPTTLPSNQAAGPFSLGSVFSVSSSPIVVSRLGAYTPDGIFGASGVQVGIYQVTISGSGNTSSLVSGNLVTGLVTFANNESSNVLGGTSTAFKSIAPVILSSGTYLIVANNYGQGGAERNYNPYYDTLGNNTATPSAGNLASANVAFGVTYSGQAFFKDSAPLGALVGSGWDNDTAGLYYTGSPTAPRYGAGNFEFSPVPETGAFSLAGALLLGLIYAGRWFSNKRKLA